MNNYQLFYYKNCTSLFKFKRIIALISCVIHDVCTVPHFKFSIIDPLSYFRCSHIIHWLYTEHHCCLFQLTQTWKFVGTALQPLATILHYNIAVLTLSIVLVYSISLDGHCLRSSFVAAVVFLNCKGDVCPLVFNVI